MIIKLYFVMIEVSNRHNILREEMPEGILGCLERLRGD